MRDVINKRGWDLLCPRMKPERAERIERYAKEYFEPALAAFPELFGNVYLSLLKYGWLAEFDPKLYIVIRESALDADSPWKIRATTAHELMHLVQFKNGVGREKYGSADVEHQATFLALGRGFAYDFLKSFPVSCDRAVCGHNHKFCYYGCGLLFKGCCRDCSDEELRAKAEELASLAKNYGVYDNPDYFALVGGLMISK